MNSITEFYDHLASDYDLMTNPGARFSKEQENFKEIIKRYSIRTALDAGSGTGFHSLLLASFGVDVTAVDISGEMLSRLQKNASDTNYTISTVQSSFQTLGEVVTSTFDAVFCLGNTLAHIPKNELPEVLTIFKKLLNEHGVLVIQMLNYDLILNKRERIVNITERENKTFIRFYDFLGSTLGFNILTIGKQGTTITHTLQTTELYPIKVAEMQEVVHSIGWNNIERYGSFALTPFDPEMSRDVIFILQKE